MPCETNYVRYNQDMGSLTGYEINGALRVPNLKRGVTSRLPYPGIVLFKL